MILILQGLPASGKSTYRDGWLSAFPTQRAYVNYDEARVKMFGPRWTFNHADEDAMKKAVMEQARLDLTAGCDLIIDNTNLHERHYQKWIQLAQEFKTTFEVKRFDTPVHVCVDQDRHRPKRVGRAVIEGMALRYGYIDWDDRTLYSNRTFVIVDVDGTVADLTHRRPFIDVKCLSCGKVNPERTKKGLCAEVITLEKGTTLNCGGEVTKKDWPAFFNAAKYDIPYRDIIKIVKLLAQDHIILVVSGRSVDQCGVITEDWLERHEIPFEHLFMRNGGDFKDDDIVKEEILSHLPKDRIAYVFDDRDRVVRMWRKHGLRVLQVSAGSF